MHRVQAVRPKKQICNACIEKGLTCRPIRQCHKLRLRLLLSVRIFARVGLIIKIRRKSHRNNAKTAT